MVIKSTCDTVITKTISVLQNGGIIVVPTSRWYMICCSASCANAIDKIFEGKQRDRNKIPLFLLPNKRLAEKYFIFNKDAAKLMEYFWPGDLSLYLNWAEIPNAFDYGNVGYALVSMESGLLGSIATAFSNPMFATSANISGETNSENLGPSISLEEVQKFIDKGKINVDLIIDGGICPMFNHTTIIDCRRLEERPMINREGIVNKRAIEVVLNNY